MSKTEDKEKQIQALLLEMTNNLSVIGDLCQELGKDSVEFLGQHIKFGLSGQLAAGGPRVFNEDWRESSFECYPKQEEWDWLWGSDVPRPNHDY